MDILCSVNRTHESGILAKQIADIDFRSMHGLENHIWFPIFKVDGFVHVSRRIRLRCDERLCFLSKKRPPKKGDGAWTWEVQPLFVDFRCFHNHIEPLHSFGAFCDAGWSSHKSEWVRDLCRTKEKGVREWWWKTWKKWITRNCSSWAYDSSPCESHSLFNCVLFV